MAKKDDEFEETKAGNDAWTGMLGLSLLALIVGCVFLYLDWSQYGKKEPPAVPKGASAAPAPAVPKPPDKKS